ncbi:class I SAM-dependent methyltransferase [bacterium]|nr:class I SAM-dependent methyltransferase [bacterium]
MTDNNEREHLFDRWASYYDDSVTDGAFPFIGYERTLDALIELADFQPAQRILDLGVGTGNLAKRVPLPAEQIWGADFSTAMLTQAAEALPGSHLHQVDLMADDWPAAIEQPFDRIISGYTFHEFADGDKVRILSRLVEGCLAPEGLILLADIAFTDAAAFEVGHKRFAESWDEEEYYWCAEEMVREISERGFQADFIQTSSCAGVFLIRPD